MTTVNAQALQKLRSNSWEGTPEEKGLEVTSENRYRGYAHEVYNANLTFNAMTHH